MRKLHNVIWEMMNPDYQKTKGLSIDHIIPEEKLDNRRENLRLATSSDQARNRVHTGTTSPYRGISLPKGRKAFEGRVYVNGKNHCVYGDTANETAAKVNALRIELLGPDTPLINIRE